MEGNCMTQSDIDQMFKYQETKEDNVKKHLTIGFVAKSLAELINDLCPDSRAKSLAFTALEESVMWANSAISKN
jgi:hypothetical protein